MAPKADPLTPERFEALITAYGADFDRWPEAERSQGRQFLLGSAHAQAMRRDAAELDRLIEQFDPYQEEPAPNALFLRVLDLPRLHPRPRSVTAVWSQRTYVQAALGLVAAAILGLVVGSLVPQSSSNVSTAESEDWQDLTELAFATGLEQDHWQ